MKTTGITMFVKISVSPKFVSKNVSFVPGTFRIILSPREIAKCFKFKEQIVLWFKDCEFY